MTSGYMRVKLPDDAAGFVGTDAVSPAGRPLRSQGVPVGTHVYEAPSSAAPIVRTLEERTSVDVLGRFGGFDLVRLASVSSFGWIARAGAQARDARAGIAGGPPATISRF
jgi:hypothetical protein